MLGNAVAALASFLDSSHSQLVYKRDVRSDLSTMHSNRATKISRNSANNGPCSDALSQLVEVLSPAEVDDEGPKSEGPRMKGGCRRCKVRHSVSI